MLLIQIPLSLQLFTKSFRAVLFPAKCQTELRAATQPCLAFKAERESRST